MPQDPVRCELWTRKHRQWLYDHELSRQLVADAEQPDDDPERWNRMMARAELEFAMTESLVELGKRKSIEFCG